jgi:MFS family permease
MLFPLALLAGLGNAVFHPADLSILSHRVRAARLGRAYAAHGIAGTFGFATSPVVVALIASYAGWRIALVAIGVAGLGLAALLYRKRALLDYPHQAATAPVASAPPRHFALAYWRVIGSPVVLMGFTYFAVTAFAGTGISTMSITALTLGYGLAPHIATLGLTLYLAGVAVGMMAGGFLAERTQRHHRVAMGGVAIAAGLMLVVANLSALAVAAVPLMMLAGVASGVTAPSRDVLIRRAAAGAGMGSVFGFVYSGFDLGSSIAPWLFGALIDHGAHHGVFVAIACAFAIGVPAVMQVQHRATARAALPVGAD